MDGGFDLVQLCLDLGGRVLHQLGHVGDGQAVQLDEELFAPEGELSDEGLALWGV